MISSPMTSSLFKEGVTAANLSRISRHFFASEAVSPLPKEAFDKMTKNSKVVVFMKGVPDEPKCGFSNAVVQIFRMHGVDKYDSYDVLKDEAIRQGIKEYTNWPTIPQIFINGEFVGGCDIMIQMHQNGDLVKELQKAGIKSVLTDDDSTNK